MPSAEIGSTEPATGAELWRGMPGDVDAEVARARASWADWASRSLAFRVEAARRFANVVRRQQDAFADLIAREPGKPLWECHAEVESVIAQVDISFAASAERTATRRLEGALGSRAAVRHQQPAVLAVLGPYETER